jgi:hypothetical protein
MILRFQIGGATLPPLSSNKIEPYCERILNVLVDDDRALSAYDAACRVIATVTKGDYRLEGYNRDAVKTAGFTDSVKKALTPSGAELENPVQ